MLSLNARETKYMIFQLAALQEVLMWVVGDIPGSRFIPHFLQSLDGDHVCTNIDINITVFEDAVVATEGEKFHFRDSELWRLNCQIPGSGNNCIYVKALIAIAGCIHWKHSI